MTKLVPSFAFGLASALSLLAQTPASTPVSQPLSSSTPSAEPVRIQRATRIGFPRDNAMNPVNNSDRLSGRVTQLPWAIGPLYRKPGSKETSALAPSREILSRYASFLRGEDTGIIRLAPDRGCVFNDRVVNVKEECLKYPFPGAGNSYSFREDSYKLRHLADVTYSKNKLQMTGIFMHGIAVDLGDVPIEAASLMTPGMKFLTEFKPSTSSEDVETVDNALVRGVRNANFVYSKEVDVVVDRTYAIRAVAYRGKVVRAAVGVRYNELDYDRRRDVVVVFRVVEIDNDGITLVWRKLSDIEPPRIKMPKKEDSDEGEAN
jgi:hypothetical protein